MTPSQTTTAASKAPASVATGKPKTSAQNGRLWGARAQD